jgi:hypothetical protein
LKIGGYATQKWRMRYKNYTIFAYEFDEKHSYTVNSLINLKTSALRAITQALFNVALHNKTTK